MANLIKILQEQKDFSETEIMIATLLLANFRKLAGMSTRQLGKIRIQIQLLLCVLVKN